jgi:hypothetical protein
MSKKHRGHLPKRYERPVLTSLGEMAAVTRKTGFVADNMGNPTQP